MAKTEAFATKLPVDVKEMLTYVCQKLGLRKNFVIEMALREKLEDLLDTYDLKEAIEEATGFHPWTRIRKEVGLKD